MGLFADTVKAMVPVRTTAVGATIPTWQDGTPQQSRESYYRLVEEGYTKDEVLYACIEARGTSASEPRMAAYVKTAKKPERVERNAILDLLENPNPFISRSEFWATIMMYRDIAGNAYIEKVRSRAGKVVELWLLRPDRVRIIPDAKTYIRGYQYEIGADKSFLPANDVIHLKTRNPRDDFYGLPPLAVAAGRVDVDNFMRQFTASFFQNAGVPSGLLNIMHKANDQERAMIQQRFKGQYGGPAGWHRLMVIDGQSATYTPMGLPLGERGVAMEALDAINEARIAMCYAVPLSIIGAKLGMASSSYANRLADQKFFWDNTLAPIYRELAACLTLDLVPEFDGVDYVEFDMSDVRALQEDQDAKHKRNRDDMLAGGISVEEFRVETGRDPKFNPKHTLVLPANLVREPVVPEEPTPEELAAEATARQAALAGPAAGNRNGRQPSLNGATNGRAN